ncbi:MAG: MoaD family protein [Arcobacteraceae bacterium]|jgi:adenylyltransferase/sulfurtransferase|nr:MoaD family protein [Campylobacterales bacterium]
MATVYIPTALRLFTDGTSEVVLVGENIGEIVTELVTKYGDLKTHLFSNEGKLRSFVNIYLNEEDVRHLDGLNTKVSEGDKVLLVPSIAGGI